MIVPVLQNTLIEPLQRAGKVGVTRRTKSPSTAARSPHNLACISNDPTLPSNQSHPTLCLVSQILLNWLAKSKRHFRDLCLLLSQSTPPTLRTSRNGPSHLYLPSDPNLHHRTFWLYGTFYAAHPRCKRRLHYNQ